MNRWFTFLYLKKKLPLALDLGDLYLDPYDLCLYPCVFGLDMWVTFLSVHIVHKNDIFFAEVKGSLKKNH